MKRIFNRIFLFLAAFLGSSFMASAQWSSADSEFTTMQTQINGVANTLVNIASLIIGLVGIGSLAIAYAKHTKGDPSAADALTKVGFGLIIVIIIIQVIKMTLMS